MNMTHADYVRKGGAESVEEIMWLAMRGALPGNPRKTHQNYYLATTTGMAVVSLPRKTSLLSAFSFREIPELAPGKRLS